MLILQHPLQLQLQLQLLLLLQVQSLQTLKFAERAHLSLRLNINSLKQWWSATNKNRVKVTLAFNKYAVVIMQSDHIQAQIKFCDFSSQQGKQRFIDILF